MSFNGRSVLVTGGAGYVGCVLIPTLLRRGYRVRIFDKLIFGDDGLRPFAGKVEIVQGDICCFDDSVLDGIDKVIHLAALSNDPTAEFSPSATIAINVGGTEKVALACLKRKVKRMILASSCSVYYSLNPYDGVLDEDAEIFPTAAYSASKKAAEDLLVSMTTPEFCPVFLRKGTIFGYSPRMRYDLVVNAFTKSAWQTRNMRVFAGGEMWRPLLDIQDAAEAYVNALELPNELVSAQSFNVLHKNYRILELAHWIKHVLRDKIQLEVEVQYRDDVPARSYQVSSDKFKKTFGYVPPRGIAQSVLALWQRLENGLNTDFENPEYYNIQWLKLLLSIQTKLAAMGSVFPN